MRTIAFALLVSALAVILVCSPAGATLLTDFLEARSLPPSPDQVRRSAQAIAVLTGRPERAETAVELHLQTGVPLIFVGRDGIEADAFLPARTLNDVAWARYGIEPRWREPESRDTRQNASFAKCVLAREGITRIALVTDRFHMPRARSHFEAAGFQVLPVPAVDWSPRRAPLTLANFVPSRAGWAAGKWPAKEIAGMMLGPLERLLDPAPNCTPAAAPIEPIPG